MRGAMRAERGEAASLAQLSRSAAVQLGWYAQLRHEICNCRVVEARLAASTAAASGSRLAQQRFRTTDGANLPNMEDAAGGELRAVRALANINLDLIGVKYRCDLIKRSKCTVMRTRRRVSFTLENVRSSSNR